MGVAAGDFNRDGRLDILKTHFADDIPALYRNLGKGLFDDAASASGLAVENRYVEWGAGMPDLDNDGFQDVVYVTGNVYPEIERSLPQYPHRGPRVVFRNTGRSTFENVTEQSGAAAARHSSRGAAFGDVDNDGDVDLLVMNMNEPPSLLRNDYAGGNGWIMIDLEGTASNRSAIGAIVEVSVAGRVQARAVLSQSSYYSHDDLRVHFGLGRARKAERVEVRWPSGRSQAITDVPSGQVVTIREAGPR
jgi:enediyne biosynthesis protein E4